MQIAKIIVWAKIVSKVLVCKAFEGTFRLWIQTE